MRALLTVLVVVFLGLFLPREGSAFVREGGNGVFAYWPAAETEINLRLGCPANGPLVSWGPCWDDAAADAALRWQVPTTQFRFVTRLPSAPADPCDTDGLQTLAFRSSLCGFSFGSALAVTFFVFNSATGAFIEADTVFDAGRAWTTYAGPLQTDASGFIINDFHRVAIHELGHVLGLDHPDDYGQSVQAIMNRRVSDLDTPQADDIAGVSAIYPGAPVPPRGRLENPQPNSFASGIGTISGWVCSANRVDLQVDGSTVIQAPYGILRGDTQGECGDVNNGFVYQVNWSGDLGPGLHTVVALADGIEIGRATVSVATFGVPFVSGASGTYAIPFNGRDVTIRWEQSLQNFVISNVQ